MTQFVIVRAKRTPFGKLMGTLAPLSAVDLGVAAGKAALADLNPTDIDLAIIGNVLSAGLGQNLARQIALGVGCPKSTPAYAVNIMCGSGLHSIALACQALATGEATAVLAGGAESMTNSPYILEKARTGYKMGDGALIDTVLRDGLTDAFDKQHMGTGAEALAAKYNLTRQAQDAFAVQSQARTAAALAAGHFAQEVTPAGKLTADEHPRPDTAIQKLATLKPAFKPDGTVTAGNASGVNDGAGLLLVTTLAHAQAKAWTPLCKITGWSLAGCEPKFFGTGPVDAINKLCSKLNKPAQSFDTIELNEAFAAQSLACIQELKLDGAKVNPDGGAIAIGHPIGASGARLACHIAHHIATGRHSSAIASLCIGGGMGIAMAFEKP
jgi:acetyl-CoA C-acetyltransferase